MHADPPCPFLHNIWHTSIQLGSVDCNDDDVEDTVTAPVIPSAADGCSHGLQPFNWYPMSHDAEHILFLADFLLPKLEVNDLMVSQVHRFPPLNN